MKNHLFEVITRDVKFSSYV